jgi:hypothetical protein
VPRPGHRGQRVPKRRPAFNALLEGFCAIWIAGGGEPIGRTLSDDEAISTLTGLLAHGLAGPRRRPPD